MKLDDLKQYKLTGSTARVFYLKLYLLCFREEAHGGTVVFFVAKLEKIVRRERQRRRPPVHPRPEGDLHVPGDNGSQDHVRRGFADAESQFRRRRE